MSAAMLARLWWLGGRRAVLLQLGALVAAGLVVLFSRGADWVGAWKVALDTGAFTVTLVGPVAAGLACIAYARLRSSGLDDAILIASRPLRAWVQPGLAVWALGSGVVVGLCLLATTWSALTGSKAFPATSWIVLPALALLAFNVALGAVLGALTGRTWVAPFVVAAVFALSVLGSVGVLADVFSTAGTTGDLVGQTFSVRVLGLQTAMFVGATVVIALGSERRLGFGSVLRRAVGYPAAGVVVVTYVVLAADVPERYVPVDRVAFECRGSAPEVCMAQETTRPLRSLATNMAAGAGYLRSAGAEVPQRFVEVLPSDRSFTGTGALLFLGEEVTGKTISLNTAARMLATPALCALYAGDGPGDPELASNAQMLVTRWILWRSGRLAVEPTAPDARWFKLPAAEQDSWIRTTYGDLTTCDLDKIRLPYALVR